jgi:O-antigen/teichoic acid export membrane protein
VGITFKNEKTRPTVGRNATWLLFGQGLRLVIQGFYFVEIARSLGASQYGGFVGVVALVGIAFPFADWGSGPLLVEKVSREHTLFAIYWGRALVTIVTTGSVLWLLVLALSRFALPAQIPIGLVVAVSASDLFGLSLITVCGNAFQAFDRLNWTAGISVLISASRLAAASALIAVHHHPTPIEWGYMYLLSTGSVALFSVAMVLSKLGRPDFTSLRTTRGVRDGCYYSLGLSAQTIYNDIDKTMLARLGTLQATGIYGAAYRLIDVSFVPINSLLIAAYANFLRVGLGGVDACFSYAKPILVRTLGYAAAVGAMLLVGAGVVPHLLGAEYAETAEALRWLAVLPGLRAVSYLFCNVLTGSGHQGVRSLVQVCVAVFNVLVNLWIIPLYSWRGAAWSSIASDGLLACGAAAAVFLIARRERADSNLSRPPGQSERNCLGMA